MTLRQPQQKLGSFWQQSATRTAFDAAEHVDRAGGGHGSSTARRGGRRGQLGPRERPDLAPKGESDIALRL